MRTTRRRSRSSKAIVPVVALAAAVGGVSLLEAPVSAGPIGTCSPTMTTVDGDTVASFITEGLCTWTIPAGASNIDVLVVGGGGSGGRSSERSVGGGGGGGVAYGTNLDLSGQFLIEVGAGGTNTQSCATWPESSLGGASSISNSDFVAVGTEKEIVADGGGRGAGCGENEIAASGGSGGGGHADWVVSGGLATQGSSTNVTVTLYGNAGGGGGWTDGLSGGGGGGASSAGTSGVNGVGGNGGAGVSIDITGTAVVYGSGGGGLGTVSVGSGGENAGDGNPAISAGTLTDYDGTPNTGGGGGGALDVTSGSGGSGIVVIRYTAAALPPTGSSTSTTLALLASALVVLGGGLTVVRRKRTA